MLRAAKHKFSKEIMVQISPLIKKDNFTNIIYLGMDWGMIIGSIILSMKYNNLFVYILAIFIIGTRMRALENMLHNGSHSMLFSNKPINDFSSRFFCAYPIFSSFNLYKHSHMEHHRWLGNQEKDPDLQRYIKLGIDKMPFTTPKMIFNLAGIFLLFNIPKYVYGNIFATVLNKDRNNELLNRIAFLFISFTVLSYFFSFSFVLKYWLVPFFTIFQMIRYMAEISEHGGLYNKSTQEIYLARNNTDKLMSFFIYPHSDNFHLIHHLFPAITHQNMSRAHEVLLQDEHYRQAHNCNGYFFSFSEQEKTTFEDLTIKQEVRNEVFN